MLELLGGVDILINNAGIYDGTDIFNMTEEIYNKVMDINAKGTYFCTKAFLRQVNTVCDNKLRKIINVLSINSFVAHSNGYALSKWSGFEMTRGLANELIGRNIIVNAVAPGPTVSNITELNNRKIEGNLYNPGRHRTNYFLLPDQIANVVTFLVSDISNGIVGQTIIVDGGETIL